jgi:ubiquinone/menaquinone biosynthesis C-methylase UbiE
MATHCCPWWLGYLLVVPVRRLIQDPKKILRPHVDLGMTALDVGCGMGFFSLDMARWMGPNGRVVCVDLQPRMINALKRRADRAGLTARIDARVCKAGDLGVSDLDGQVDFAVAFYMVHEVPDSPVFLRQVHSVLKPGGRFLMAEPRGHVSEDAFQKSTSLALEAGFRLVDAPRIWRSRTALFQKGSHP